MTIANEPPENFESAPMSESESMLEGDAAIHSLYGNGQGYETGYEPESSPQDQHDPADEEEDDVSLRATELANAEEVHKRFGINLRYDFDRGKFIVWRKTHWKVDVDGAVQRAIKTVARETKERLLQHVEYKSLIKHVVKMESSAGVNGVAKLLQTEPGVAIQSDQLNTQLFRLPAANGTIDLETGSLAASEREHYFTRCLSTKYDPGAECPTFQAFLDRIMASKIDMITYLQRVLGLCLTGFAGVQELFIFHGEGSNGKSTLLDLMIWLLGEFAGSAPESLLITRQHGQEHPTELAGLLGLRLVVASETTAGGKLRLQLVKKLTGDATIKARFMRQDYFEFIRTHKMILMTNNKPEIEEQTEAAWRRIRLIPFAVIIPEAERDTNLLEKLKAEAEGILAWLVRGCLQWQKEGMNPPADVLAATSDYKADSDRLGEFVTSRCIVMEDARVERGELYTDYTKWANAAGERHALERNQFYDLVRKLPGVTDGQWKLSGNKPVRGFKGIGLCGGSQNSPYDP